MLNSVVAADVDCIIYTFVSVLCTMYLLKYIGKGRISIRWHDIDDSQAYIYFALLKFTIIIPALSNASVDTLGS